MFVNPAKIIDILGIGPSMTVADFGCGSGHYSIEAGRRIGKGGKVYAIDIQQEMLGHVRGRSKAENLNNIETIWTDLEKPKATRLKDNSVDFVIISNILFQAENREQVLKEALRILKNNGKIMAVEWDDEKEKNDFGPLKDSRISIQSARDIFEKSGFIFEKEFNPGEHHYGLIFRKV